VRFDFGLLTIFSVTQLINAVQWCYIVYNGFFFIVTVSLQLFTIYIWYIFKFLVRLYVSQSCVWEILRCVCKRSMFEE
jgi:hypothetical protein